MNWYTAEFQSSGLTGTVIPFALEDRAHAEAKYHSILAVAALSDVMKHGAILFCDDTEQILYGIKSYEHGEIVRDPSWYVIEYQNDGETGSVIPWSYDNRPDAESKYHAILSAAANSHVKYHGAICFGDDGYIAGAQSYHHIEEEVN